MKGLCQAEGALGEELAHLQALLLKKTYSVAKKKKGGWGVRRKDQNHLGVCGAAWDPWLIITAANISTPHTTQKSLQTPYALENLEKARWPLFPMQATQCFSKSLCRQPATAWTGRLGWMEEEVNEWVGDLVSR